MRRHSNSICLTIRRTRPKLSQLGPPGPSPPRSSLLQKPKQQAPQKNKQRAKRERGMAAGTVAVPVASPLPASCAAFQVFSRFLGSVRPGAPQERGRAGESDRHRGRHRGRHHDRRDHVSVGFGAQLEKGKKPLTLAVVNIDCLELHADRKAAATLAV